MALQITVTRNGETANYWRLVRMYVNFHEKDAVFELRGYATQAQANAEKNTGQRTAKFKFRFSLDGVDFPDITGAGWVANIYTAIKSTTRYQVNWSTAIDV